jgi:hypothetical protein
MNLVIPTLSERSEPKGGSAFADSRSPTADSPLLFQTTDKGMGMGMSSLMFWWRCAVQFFKGAEGAFTVPIFPLNASRTMKRTL